MRNKQRVATMGLAVVASVAVLGGAFAYFTDYESKDLSARAGTLTMNITEATEDLSNGLTIINPGDSNPLKFTVNNTGEKSMDVKAVLTVSAPQAFTDDDHELLWSSIFVTLMANKIGGLQFGIYRNCQISSRVFHTAVAALPLTKANRSDFE